jgi:hypothetical protein
MQSSQPPLLFSVAMYTVIAGLLIWRYSRPQKISVVRLFIAPIFLLAMTALSIWGSQQISPAPALMIAAALAAGAILGAPLGYLRGQHTNVRATEKPGVMFLDSSWVVLGVWLGAFVIRAFLRFVFRNGETAALLGDGLLAFAISTVIVSYFFIYEKYKSLEVQAGQA